MSEKMLIQRYTTWKEKKELQKGICNGNKQKEMLQYNNYELLYLQGYEGDSS